MARFPVCPLPAYRVYKKVADSGDVVIQKRGFSIVDTHEPAIATPLSPFFLDTMNSNPHRYRISLIGRHQGVLRFVLSGLHITSVSSHCGMSRYDSERVERHTSISFGPLLPSPVILCHLQAFRSIPRRLRNGGEERRCWSMVRRSVEGHAFSLSYLRLC